MLRRLAHQRNLLLVDTPACFVDAALQIICKNLPYRSEKEEEFYQVSPLLCSQSDGQCCQAFGFCL